MCFIEVDDLALNGQVMPVIQMKISFSIIGNKQVTINYLINYFTNFYPIKLGKHKSLQIHFTIHFTNCILCFLPN